MRMPRGVLVIREQLAAGMHIPVNHPSQQDRRRVAGREVSEMPITNECGEAREGIILGSFARARALGVAYTWSKPLRGSVHTQPSAKKWYFFSIKDMILGRI
jgi:hypothetical protein